MAATRPHYKLFSDSTLESEVSAETAAPVGHWRIVLEATDGSNRLEAEDDEALPAERLALLAVIRGLEAIPEPARVTLETTSPYVRRGLRFGLVEWRENGWQWEQFGEQSEVANADLWQRLDRALQIHRVQCRSWRSDACGEESSAESCTSTAACRALDFRPRPVADDRAARRRTVGARSWLKSTGSRRPALCAS